MFLDNPFITTGYAGAEYFCDREKETADLIRLLSNGNNVALISPRRFGKTDLLRHCFSRPEVTDRFYTFIIDIYPTKSEAEMVNKMGRMILETLKPKGRKVWEQFVLALTSVKTGITFDINGTPSWTIGVGDIESPGVTLEEIFSYLRTADKPCLVAIDEFQQITKYPEKNVEAALRSQVQTCPNARFIFSGSGQHLMSQMFSSPARPFYQSATPYYLNPLPKEKYAAFCEKLFHDRGKNLDAGVVDRLYEMFDGVTYYLQRTMNELFDETEAGETCTVRQVDEAVKTIVDLSAPIYEDFLYQLPQKQSQLLLAVCKAGTVKNITSSKFIKAYGLTSANSVKSAAPALLDKGLLAANHGEYQAYDKFFQIWARQQQ